MCRLRQTQAVRCRMGVAALCLALAAAFTGGSVEAQRRQQWPVPLPGEWCGLTDQGGGVRLVVSADSRFIESLSAGGAAIGDNGVAVRRIQIAEGKFILRSRGGSGADGGSRGRGGEGSSGGGMIRGTFDGPDTMHGTSAGGGARTTHYVAWPASRAPCP